MILLFSFFYVGIVFNPTELADNMRKNGGFIPGIRPGRTTSEHVSRILKRLTFIGAIYLGDGLLAAGMDDRGYSPRPSWDGASGRGLTGIFRCGFSRVSACSSISAARRF